MRKKIIIYGNCHTTAIIKHLKKNKEFNHNYKIIPIEPIQNIKDPVYFERSIWRECDIFIHQGIRKNNRYGQEYSSDNIISKLKEDCDIIAIPNVYHMPLFLFPQYYEKKELRYRNETFFFRDKIIDDGIESGKTCEEIATQYNSTYFDEKKIRADYNAFIKKVKDREVYWDIKVSDFFEKNIKKEQLFFDPNHPTDYLINYYVEELLKILLPNKSTKCKQIDYRLDSYEMPILPVVREALGLSYPREEYELRKTGNKLSSKRMYLKQYVKQYIEMLWTCDEYEYETVINGRKDFEFSEKYLRYVNIKSRIKTKIERIL